MVHKTHAVLSFHRSRVLSQTTNMMTAGTIKVVALESYVSPVAPAVTE